MVQDNCLVMARMMANRCGGGLLIGLVVATNDQSARTNATMDSLAYQHTRILNLLKNTGQVGEWLIPADCKSAASAT